VRRIRRRGLLSIAAIAAGVVVSAQAPPQQPPPQTPTFRTGVRTVAVPTSVFTPHGDIVTTLGRDQFLVFDDTTRQELTVFESGQHPITALVLLDTSASMIPRLDLVRQAAEQFIVRLWPGDRARVGSFSDRVQFLGDFTDDRDTLLRTLREDLHVGNPTRLIDAVGEGMTTLSPLPGRRVLVVFTDGCDTFSKLSYDGLLARLPAEEFMVYAVQVSGGATARNPTPRYGMRNTRGGCIGTEHDFEMSVLPAEGLSDFLRLNNPARILTPAQVLTRLTAETGGGHFMLTPRDDVNATFTHVMFELHHQYLLGFSPQTNDGKRHTITVRVSERDLIVRARRAYLAARP
jgi:Ca-activated chloride channel homolog